MKPSQQPNFAPLQTNPARGLLGRPKLLLALLALLIALLATVVLLLPGWVKNSVTAPPGTELSTSQAASAPETAAPGESPWQDAQLAEQRRRAQDLLSELLEAQQQLQKQQVEQWAEAEYQQALQLAEAADQTYRQRQFERAQAQYRQALAALQQLLAQVPEIYRAQIARGQRALEQGEVDAAKAAFTLASQLQTGDEADRSRARALLARAEVAPQLAELLAEGQRRQRQGRWDEAVASYRRALALDGQSSAAQSALQQAQQTLAEQGFKQHMSAAFKALEAGRYGAAKQSFKRALGQRPGDGGATAGLAQAEAGLRQAAIAGHLAKAKAAAGGEQWASAQSHYQQALALAPAEVAAKVGKIEADARRELDEALQQALGQRSQLQDPVLRQRQRQLLERGQQIKQPGARLQQQLTALAANLAAAERPVAVELRSDGQTRVQLLRQSSLGSFARQQLSLLPGRYTALGSRRGYRDVRVEFEVAPGSGAKTIEVICRERI